MVSSVITLYNSKGFQFPVCVRLIVYCRIKEVVLTSQFKMNGEVLAVSFLWKKVDKSKLLYVYCFIGYLPLNLDPYNGLPNRVNTFILVRINPILT